MLGVDGEGGASKVARGEDCGIRPADLRCHDCHGQGVKACGDSVGEDAEMVESSCEGRADFQDVDLLLQA